MDGEKNSFISRLAGFVVDRRGWFLALFAAMIVFSVFSIRWIQVEDDITWYLPEDAEARQGLLIMEEEFITYGSAKVMVKQISPEDAQALSDRLTGLRDVALVRHDGSDAYTRDGCALFDLTFADTPNAPRSEQALERVKAELKDLDAVVYSEVGFSLSKLVAEQMLTVLVFVIIVVLAVLVFTSSTYAEIPVMILTFLVAAVVNVGTHFLMGTISFVSNSVGIVLQLALSVDYAIIFCNRYKEEHERLSVRDAVVRSLAVSIPEISASSLTTIAGLTAMTLMKFRLGVDLGLTLIKAILCSLLTVFIFMPALLMLFGPAMDRTRHRRFVPKISFVGRFAYASRFVVPVLLVLLVAGGYMVFRQVNYAYGMDLVPAFRKTEMERAKEEISDAFGAGNTVAVIVPAGDLAAEKALLEELSDCPEVKSATGLAAIEAVGGYSLGDEVDEAAFARLAGIDETAAKAVFAYYAAEHGEHRAVRDDPEHYRAALLDLFFFLHDRMEAGDVELDAAQRERVRELYDRLDTVRAQLSSANYSRLILDLDLPVQAGETFRFLDRIHHIAAQYYDGGVVLTGDSVSALGFRDSFASDNTTVGLMSLGLVMLILFFTFRSFGMPLLLILVIQGSIWLNFAVAALKGDNVFFLCYLIVGAIQMGANIDYAIVVSSRYREFCTAMEKREAIIETLNLAFPTVITSGLMMVCAGLLVGFGVSQCIIAGMGYYVGTGTIISLILILFALPQVLLLGDGFVSATTLRLGATRLPAVLQRNRLRLTGAILAAACVLSLWLSPRELRRSEEWKTQTDGRIARVLERTQDLHALAGKLEDEGVDINALRYRFAEQLVTEQIGPGRLAEGEKQLKEGEEQYDSGLEQYTEGAERLAKAEAQLRAGAAELAAAQKRYDDGLAEYEDGKARYEEGKRELEQGQAAYDLMLAAYEAGKTAYEAEQQRLAEAQAALDELEAQEEAARAAWDEAAARFGSAEAMRKRVDELQKQYDEAMARQDYAQAFLIGAALATAREALETLDFAGLASQYTQTQTALAELRGRLAAAREEQQARMAAQLDAGERLKEAEELLAEKKEQLDEGYEQLAEAERQLQEAEKQLEEGKHALEAGYRRLAEGRRQLEEGRAELEEADRQLKEGEEKLEDSRRQLEEGRRKLEENLEALEKSLIALDELSDETERLEQGLRLLREEKDIRAVLPALPGPLAVLSAAESELNALLRQTDEAARSAHGIAWLLISAAVLAAAGVLLTLLIKRANYASAALSAAAVLAGMAAFILWRSRCAAIGGRLPLAALLLALSAALFSELLFRSRRRQEK